MADQQILRFIAQQAAAGKTEAQIRDALKTLNYPQAEIDAAYHEWNLNPSLVNTPEVGRFIGQSWELYKSMFRQFMMIYKDLLLKAVIAAAPGSALVLIGWYLDRNGQISEETLMKAGIGLAVIYIFIALYFILWVQVSLMFAVRNREQNLTSEQVLENSKGILGSYFSTGFLNGVLVFLWTLLLIIPGIIFAVYYILATYIVIDKGLYNMDAIRMSKKYVEGLWWKVLSSLLGMFAVIIIVTIIGNVIGGTHPFVHNVISVVLNLLVAPFEVIYIFLLYEKLKSLKPEIV